MDMEEPPNKLIKIKENDEENDEENDKKENDEEIDEETSAERVEPVNANPLIACTSDFVVVFALLCVFFLCLSVCSHNVSICVISFKLCMNISVCIINWRV